MEEIVVSPETAQLALDAGFDKDCFYHYTCRILVENSVSHKNHVATHHLLANTYDFKIGRHGGGHSHSIAAPTQPVLQKWLREVHNAHVKIVPEFYTTGINYNWQVLFYDPTAPFDCLSDKSTGLYGDNGEFPTYESALEAGLHEALKRLS